MVSPRNIKYSVIIIFIFLYGLIGYKAYSIYRSATAAIEKYSQQNTVSLNDQDIKTSGAASKSTEKSQQSSKVSPGTAVSSANGALGTVKGQNVQNPPAAGNSEAQSEASQGNNGENGVSDSSQTGNADSENGQTSGSDAAGSGNIGGNSGSGNEGAAQGKTSLEEVVQDVPLPVAAGKVEEKAEAIVGGDIAIDDYLTVGFIVLKKLTPSEITYLFGAASSQLFLTTPVEELENIRSILFSKLNEDELATLRALARKYGRSSVIIDPTKSIPEEKAKLMESINKSSE